MAFRVKVQPGTYSKALRVRRRFKCHKCEGTMLGWRSQLCCTHLSFNVALARKHPQVYRRAIALACQRGRRNEKFILLYGSKVTCAHTRASGRPKENYITSWVNGQPRTCPRDLHATAGGTGVENYFIRHRSKVKVNFRTNQATYYCRTYTSPTCTLYIPTHACITDW